MKVKLYRFPVLLAALLIVAIVVIDVQAQPDPPERRHRREQVETVIIGKFATELELTPEQAERFFPLFGAFRSSAEETQHQQRQIREQLDAISFGAESAQQNVGELIDQQEKNQQQAIRLKSDFLKNVSAFLTPQQVSRCSVLLDELPIKMQALIQEERRRQHEDNPPGPRGR
jgi:Spy/CpxP family protein refolding chaperone